MGAIGFGISDMTSFNRVPKPPARIIASDTMRFSEKIVFDKLADDMSKENMSFLNPRCIYGGDINQVLT